MNDLEKTALHPVKLFAIYFSPLKSHRSGSAHGCTLMFASAGLWAMRARIRFATTCSRLSMKCYMRAARRRDLHTQRIRNSFQVPVESTNRQQRTEQAEGPREFIASSTVQHTCMPTYYFDLNDSTKIPFFSSSHTANR